MEYFTNTGLILSKFYRFENSWIRYFIYFMWYNSIPFNLCFQSYLLQMQKHFSWIFVDAGSELHLFIGLLKFFLFSYWSNVKNSFLSLVDQVNKSFLLTNIHSFQWEHFFSYFSCVILVFFCHSMNLFLLTKNWTFQGFHTERFYKKTYLLLLTLKVLYFKSFSFYVHPINQLDFFLPNDRFGCGEKFVVNLRLNLEQY